MRIPAVETQSAALNSCNDYRKYNNLTPRLSATSHRINLQPLHHRGMLQAASPALMVKANQAFPPSPIIASRFEASLEDSGVCFISLKY